MPADQQWRTVEELNAARERFEAAIPGWRLPAAWSVGLATHKPDEATVFPSPNAGTGPLPAVVLATVLGHTGGTATYELTPEVLDRLIDTVSPALACTELPHPNTHSWLRIRDEIAAAGPENAYAVAVFVADLADPVVDEHDAALRCAITAH